MFDEVIVMFGGHDGTCTDANVVGKAALNPH